MFKLFASCAMVAVASTRSAPRTETVIEGNTEGGANVLTGDFLTGFESGIFLRDKPDQIKEYSCPKAKI